MIPSDLELVNNYYPGYFDYQHRNLGRCYTLDNFSFCPYLNKEVPLFLAKKYPFKNNTFLHIYTHNTPNKNIKNFYNTFKDLDRFRAFTLNNKIYYVAKGIICNENYRPLVMITHKFTQEWLDIKNNTLDRSLMRIYLCRDIFEKDFPSNNKKLHKELFDVFLPYFMNMDVPIIIKRDLNMFESVHIDPTKSPIQVTEDFFNNLDKHNEQVFE